MNGTSPHEDCLACPMHVKCIRTVANHLKSKIGFHAGTHVEVALVKESPTTVRTLDSPQINGDLLFKLLVDRLAPVVAKQNVLRWNRRIRLEFEHPVSVALLALEQGAHASRSRFLYLRWPECIARLLGECQRHAAASIRLPTSSAAR